MFARIKRLLARARELFPLTNLGLFIAAGSLLAYFGFGAPRADYVVQLVSVLSLTLTIAAILIVIFGAILMRQALVRWERRSFGSSAVLQFEAHRGFGQALELPAWRWFPLLETKWEWESPSGFKLELAQIEDRLIEQVESEVRGSADVITRRFTVEDAFGLARVVFRRTEDRSVRVLPWVGELDRSPLLRSVAAGDELPHPAGELVGDRVDMRRYVAGDPLRLVLWKVYARTRQLMVRTPERAVAPSVRIAAYLPATIGDEPAAAAARVAIDAGLLGEGWVFSADGADRAADDPTTARQLLIASRQYQGTPSGDAAGLAPFMATQEGADPPRLILFLPARPGAWLEPVIEVVRRHRGRVSAVVVTDGVRDVDPAVERNERLLKVPGERSPLEDGFTTMEALAIVTHALTGAGAEVMALDRPSGRGLGSGSSLLRSVA